MRRFFSRLFGNEQTKSRLGNAILTDTLAHAFIIHGPQGSGKRTLAKEISAALNCENRGADGLPLPCAICNTCKRIYGDKFTDITYLRRQNKATIGVDEVRAIRDDMYLAANESDYKIYVIEEADKMTPNAQNALLKVLEEPPTRTVIFLIADSTDKILSTIKSRAQSIGTERFGNEALKRYILQSSERGETLMRIAPETFDGIIVSADGRIGRALELLSEKTAKENAEERAATVAIIKSLRQNAPYSELYSALSELPSGRLELADAIETVMLAIRDLILMKYDEDAPLLFFTSKTEATEAAKGISTKRLIAIYDIFKDALNDNTRNVGIGAVITDLGAKIKLI